MPARKHPGTIYLIHLDRRLAHASHYLGWTADADAGRRLADHLAGRGSPLLRAARDAGIAFTVVRTWTGGRKLERKLKDMKNAPRRLCPLCRAAARGQALEREKAS